VAEWDVLFAMAVGWYSINITHLWKSVKSADNIPKAPHLWNLCNLWINEKTNLRKSV
jgi:hypothetical protein